MSEIDSPVTSLKKAIAFDVSDWSTSKGMAWVYGIVCGWDRESFRELSAKYGWDKKAIKRLKRLHKKFNELENYDQPNPTRS